MSSEGGDEATAVPVRIHEHLALAAAPAPVHPFGVGATWSRHTLLQRGLDTPTLIGRGDPEPGTSRLEVTLDSDLAPSGPIRVPGRVDDVDGILDGARGPGTSPRRTPRTRSPAACSSPRSPRSRRDRGRCCGWGRTTSATSRECSSTPPGWPRPPRPVTRSSSATGARSTTRPARRRARRSPRSTPDSRKLIAITSWTCKHLLTGEEGLASSPLAPLQPLEQGTTHDALARAVVPPPLIASDGIHLNGWGNLVLSWAIVRRMQELRWL
ncbi:hypothetical protein [Brachybacterium sp. GPGPB12]|uniref:hypothetical protein n=1 Tax=Brachybacterium sp. GPGPB12 TaxID=3023517 RepID=UPI0031343F46